MKKLLYTIALLLVTLGMQAQTENANRMILHDKEGKTTVFDLTKVDFMEFDEVGAVELTLAVKEGSVTVDGFTVTLEQGAGCASWQLALRQGDETMKEEANATSEMTFTELSPATTYTVAATPLDMYGIAGETKTLNVTTLSQPKVGDYYYSDGTWSDGGLVSINPDGTGAVWAAEKPAPVEGKAVIGIVCITDPGRIAPDDKAAGFTNGYVIGTKNIQDPGKSNFSQYPESVWYMGQYAKTEAIKVTKIGKSCYENLNGREETTKTLEAQDEQYLNEDVPLFYYGTAPQYPLAAPEGTSGWFIPSVGQVWSCIANFCSGEVAAYLAENTTLAYDFTAYLSKTVGTCPLDDFMKVFAKVPDADSMSIADGGSNGKQYVSLATSSRYDSESRVIFILGMNGYGLIEGMCGWFNEESHGRPFLAF